MKIPDTCPTCFQMTPNGKMVCPYCPWPVRRAQYIGAALAYAIAFLPILFAIVALWRIWP